MQTYKIQATGKTVRNIRNSNTKFSIRILLFFPALSFFISIASVLFAGTGKHDFISKQKLFVNELFKGKRYFDCIAETQRLLNYNKNISTKPDYQYLINTCYYLGGQYKTVISNLEKNLKNPDRAGLANLFLLSHSYSKLNYHKTGYSVLNNLRYDQIKSSEGSLLFRNRIILLLKEFSYGEIVTEIEKADEYLNGIFGDYSIDDLRESMKHNELGLKSKWLSVSMSALLPGSGQMYSGRILDGIISFLAVAGSAFGSYYSYKNNEKPLAITLAFFSGLFYAGNLYGAYNSAEYTNLRLRQDFNSQIIQKYNLGYNPEYYISNKIFK